MQPIRNNHLPHTPLYESPCRVLLLSTLALAVIGGLALFAYFGRGELQTSVQARIAFATVGGTAIGSLAYIFWRQCCVQTSSPSRVESAQVRTPLSSVKEIVEAWDPLWNGGSFPAISLSKEDFKEALETNNTCFTHLQREPETFGYVQRIEVPERSRIFVRADLHGDLKSLLANLKALQQEGLLDQEFRCQQNVHLIFLGDYTNRGSYSAHVLYLLLKLRLENPHSIHLLRGNHESARLNAHFWKKNDVFFNKIVTDNFDSLEKMYETMPLSLYLAQEGEKREYAQFAHGIPEPAFDPSELLDGEKKIVSVPHALQLSERIKKLADSSSAVQESAKRVMQIADQALRVERNPHQGELDTFYNWGHIDQSRFKNLRDHGVALLPEDLAHLQRVASTTHSVSLLLRGHAHKFEERQNVITLPVGADSCEHYNKEFEWADDRAYVIEIAPRVDAWRKRALTRSHKGSETKISNSLQMHSPSV